MEGIQALFSVFLFFFCKVAVGVGGSDEIDHPAPTQTAPQQVGFGSGRDFGADKVSRGPHDDCLGWSHTPGVSIDTTYLVPGTCYIAGRINRRMPHTTYPYVSWSRVYICGPPISTCSYYTLEIVALLSTRYVLVPVSIFRHIWIPEMKPEVLWYVPLYIHMAEKVTRY